MAMRTYVIMDHNYKVPLKVIKAGSMDSLRKSIISLYDNKQIRVHPMKEVDIYTDLLKNPLGLTCVGQMDLGLLKDGDYHYVSYLHKGKRTPVKKDGTRVWRK